jgi:hypothetical protein
MSQNLTEEQWKEIQRRTAGSSPPIPEKPKLPRGMNRWESLYATELEALRLAGEIQWWGFETMRLVLAQRTTYCPDFLVITKSGLQFHEVKGFIRDDAMVKFKVASKAFPFAEFLMLRKVKGSQGFEIFKRMRGGVHA